MQDTKKTNILAKIIGMKRVALLFFKGYSLFAQTHDADSSGCGLDYKSSYIGDFLYNAAGGKQQGLAYLGMASLGIHIETEKLRLWKGGSIYVLGKSVHGHSPTEKLVGDFQTISNIDGGEHTYLHEFWYKQRFNNWSITAGLQDANEELAVNEVGDLFVQSSFGIPSVVAESVPIAIFPLTNIGVTLQAHIHENIDVSAAVYNGNPNHFEANPYNTDWKFDKQDGILSIAECKIHSTSDDYITVGYYNHSGLEEYNDSIQQYELSFEQNYGAYSIINYTAWQHPQSDTKLGVFVQAAISPKAINENYYYIGFGGVLSNWGKAQSAVGIGIAHAGFNNNTSETIIETSLQTEIAKQLFIQPNIHYVIHPSGSNSGIKNALVAGLRIIVELN